MVKDDVGSEIKDCIARRILDVCRTADSRVKLSYVAVDELDRTTVRLAASATSSIHALQRAMRTHFPLSKIATSENVLDGTIQAQIVVPNADDEWSLAQTATGRRWTPRLLSAVSVFLAACGLVAWVLPAVTQEI